MDFVAGGLSDNHLIAFTDKLQELKEARLEASPLPGLDVQSLTVDSPVPFSLIAPAAASSLCLVRLVIARCSVDYVGRLTAHLPEAIRLLLVKNDGSLSIHADDRAYKPLMWMWP